MSAGFIGRKEYLQDGLAYAAARFAGGMPGWVKIALSGKPPVVADGQTLDPGLQLLLSTYERRAAPPIGSVGPEAARANFERRIRITNGPPLSVGGVRDLVVAGAKGGLAARLYSSDEPSAPRPLLVFFHGGGFVLGSIETHDVPCRLLCRHSGANVLSVDYGLAPEHPFPEPVEDACAALKWATENAAYLGSDPQRIVVGGDSAGGALAANAATKAIEDDDTSTPVLQALLYPVTDISGGTESRRLFAEDPILGREILAWFEENYAPGADAEDPRLSATKIAPSVLAKLPPTIVVTAGFDPLRDEGEEYAGKLAEAGVPTVSRRFPGLVHGFANMVGVNGTSHDALVETAGMMRAMLEAIPTARSRRERGVA